MLKKIMLIVALSSTPLFASQDIDNLMMSLGMNGFTCGFLPGPCNTIKAELTKVYSQLPPYNGLTADTAKSNYTTDYNTGVISWGNQAKLDSQTASQLGNAAQEAANHGDLNTAHGLLDQANYYQNLGIADLAVGS